MIRYSALKQRFHAGLMLVGWLLVTLFSCGSMATAMGGTVPFSDSMSNHTQHDMAMTGSDHHSMPCCDELQSEPTCCDALTVVPASEYKTGKFFIVADVLATAVPASVDLSWLGQRSIPVVCDSPKDQQILDSYPRLHLVNCTLLN